MDLTQNKNPTPHQNTRPSPSPNPNTNPNPNTTLGRRPSATTRRCLRLMEPSGAEVRLYRRSSHGAVLEGIATLHLVVPPRLLEVDPDPPVEEVDGEVGRSVGLYLALLQDGQVIDVARLLPYAGEPAGAEEEAENYWETGSNTSENNWIAAPSRDRRVFEYRSSDDDQMDSSDVDHDKASALPDSSDGDPDKGTDQMDSSDGNLVDWDLTDSSDGAPSSSGPASFDGLEVEEEEETEQHSSSQEDIDKEGYEDDEESGEEDEEEEDTDKEGGGEEDEEHSDKEEDGNDGDDDTGEEEDGNDEEDDDTGEEEISGTNDDNEDAQHGNFVSLKLGLWPAKKHLRIKIFCDNKWMTTKVYRLTWINSQALEELYESSFKKDVTAPVAKNTVFRIRNCLMDFEVHMPHSPIFDELAFEFKLSVMDFKFCQKLGGEDTCRVFKCLSHGHKFALKTICLKKSCSLEPREVDIISSLKDKRIMAFYQAWIEPWIYKENPEADYLFIQLEMCQSTLKELLLPENFDSIPDRMHLSEEIAKGVKTIHDEFIVHRDLKPDNIFFGGNMGVRVGDFGDSCIGRNELGGYGGTPELGTKYYSAPELEFSEKITERADTYSVGVIFLELFTRFRTFYARMNVFEDLRKEGVPIPDDCCGLASDPQAARGLVERMTAVNPASRPSDREILDYIQQ